MPRSYSVTPLTYVGLSVFSGGPSFLLLFVPQVIAYPSQPTWKILLGAIGAVGIPVFVCYWLSRFRLDISAEAVIYSSLFDGEKSVRFSEIIDAGFVGSGRGCRRTALKIVAPNTTLVISYHVFSGKARQDLFNVLKVIDENGYREI